jgi:hypothetical protein
MMRPDTDGVLLRCPLCAQNVVVASEAECEAHIANCKGFHSEFGPGTSRSGLVTGFEDATSAVPAPPARAPEPLGSDERMEKIAEALTPLVPVARAESSAHTLEEAVDLVAHLAAALVSSAGEGTDEDFGIEELVSVTLGPFIAPLGEQQAKHVLGGITAALAACQGAPSGSVGMGAGAALSESLRRSLLRRHAPPKPLPPPEAVAATTAAAGAGAAGAAAVAEPGWQPDARVPAEGGTQHAISGHQAGWHPGARVSIFGLTKAAQHNGKYGRLSARAPPSGGGEGRRLGVELEEGGAVISVRCENLLLAPVPVEGL